MCRNSQPAAAVSPVAPARSAPVLPVPDSRPTEVAAPLSATGNEQPLTDIPVPKITAVQSVRAEFSQPAAPAPVQQPQPGGEKSIPNNLFADMLMASQLSAAVPTPSIAVPLPAVPAQEAPAPLWNVPSVPTELPRISPAIMYKVKQMMSDAYGARVSILAHDLSSPDAADRKQMLEAVQFMLYVNWIFAG